MEQVLEASRTKRSRSDRYRLTALGLCFVAFDGMAQAADALLVSGPTGGLPI